MDMDFLQIINGETIGRDRIPHLDFDKFRRQALAVVDSGGKVVHYFAYQDGSTVKLLAVLRTDRL